MDAAKITLSRTAVLLTSALFLTASGYAQTTGFSLNGGSSPASVTLSGTNPTSVSVASTTSTNITYTATTSYASDTNNPDGVQWMCLNQETLPGCGTASGLTTPNTLTISTIGSNANSPFLPAGAHTAVITLTATGGSPTATITVTYTPGTNTGGGTQAVNATPTSLSASTYFGGTTSAQFSLSTTSASPIAFTLTTTQSWITFSQVTGSISASQGSYPITAFFNGYGQVQGQLTGFITVSYSTNSFNIPVTFGNGVGVSGGGSGGISVSPNPLALTYVYGSFVFPYATVTLNGNSGITYSASASSSNNWLLVNGNNYVTGLFSSQSVSVSTNGNISGLSAGTTYTGTVTFNGSDGSTVQLTVNLTVNGANTSGITISPNPITLSAPLNGAAQTATVTISSSTGGLMNVGITGSGLTVSPTSANLAAGGSTGVLVTANPSGLTSQTYNGTLTVTVGGNTLTAPVNFTVGSSSSGGGTTGSILAAPAAMGFVYQVGSGMQPSQQQQLYLAGSGNYTSSVSNAGSWLSTSCTGGTLPSQFCYIYSNATGLSAGTYTGSITFSNTSTGSTSVVSVTLLVTGTTSIYTIPGDLVFSFIGGTTSSTQFQDFTVLASDNSAQPISVAVANPSNTPWLTVNQNGSSTTGTGAVYSVTANTSSLANGTYTGNITITASGAYNSPLTVPVVVNVTNSSVSGGGGGTGSLTLSTSSLTFSVPVNSTPTNQQLTLNASTATTFTATATESNCGSWLTISPAGTLTTPTTLTVTANPTGLQAQTCNGTITLVSPGGTQTVNVTMTVGGTTGGGGTLSVSVNGGSATTSPSLTFTATALNQALTAQSLNVASASGSSGLYFTASLSGTSCSWVNLGITQNAQYFTPVTVNVGATTTGVASGSYTCTLTLTPVGGGTAVTVPLTLNVNGSPTITVPSTPLTFSYSAGGSAPASQTITITGAGSAAANFTASATSTPSGWLSVSPATGTASSTASGTVTVSVNPSGLAAGSYTGTVSIGAGTGTTGSGTVTVTLTVTAPTPSITSIVNGGSFLGGSISPGEFVTIFGSQLGPLTPIGPSIGTNGNVTTTAGQVQVLFGTAAAPLTYVSSTQINCTVPYEIAGQSSVAVTVKYLGTSSNVQNLTVANSAPGIFSANGSGTGQGAILNQNSTLNTAGNPAAIGSIIQIFMTGEGLTSPLQADGAITPNATTVPVLPIAVKIGNQPATVVFEGEAPGIIAGVLQLNVTIPPGVSAGANAVQVTIGSNTSQSNLTVSVQ